jgi:hypothetical protein
MLLRKSAIAEVDQLQAMSQDLAAAYARAEATLKESLARQVKRGLEKNPDDVARALDLAQLRRKAALSSKGLSNLSHEAAQRIVDKAGQLGTAAALQDLADATKSVSPLIAPRSKGGLSIKPGSQEIKQTINRRLSSNPAMVALVEDLQSTLEDASKRVLRWGDDVYRAAVSQSTTDLLLGLGTTQTAQQVAWQRLVSNGTTTFRDVTGRRWNLASYVEMATRTASRRAWDVQHTDTMRESGVELCTIAVGSGSCARCASVSGKIYGIDNGPSGTVFTTNFIGGKTHVDVAGSLDDARAAGWRHPNCRCRVVAYMPGLSAVSDETTYDPQAEADRARLRDLERQTRASKGDAAASVSPQAKRAADLRTRELQGKIREHTARTGLARLPYREQINLGHKPGGAMPSLKVAPKPPVNPWLGKPKPVFTGKVPIAPVAGKLSTKEFDPWLVKVKKRFYDNGVSIGSKKTDLTQSNNWTLVRQVIDKHSVDALNNLKQMQYLDEALHKEALQAMAKSAAASNDPLLLAKYNEELARFNSSMAAHKADTEAWRKANGITSPLTGMDTALRHETRGAGIDWATKNMPVATGAARNAIREYTGASYYSWNNDLRIARGNPLKGSYADLTKKADAGFHPVPGDIIVHRGTTWKEFMLGDGTSVVSMPPPPPSELIGSVQTQWGYASTSVGDQAAFAGKPVQLAIKVPKGAEASWVAPFSAVPGERELLLARGSQFYVHAAYQSGGKWIVEVEVIPKGVTLADLTGAALDPASKPFTL